MNEIDKAIEVIDKKICKNIERFDDYERGLLSQNILSDLRDLVEHISLKSLSDGRNIDITYDNIKEANNYVKTKSKMNFLSKFHKSLQISMSHYTPDEANAERLMLKYYEYMLKMKDFLKDTYDIGILANISMFPFNLDSNLKEYYEKIVERIEQPISSGYFSEYNDRYYIHRIKPFFVNQKIYYEVTFTVANDRISKFNRNIAFTKIDIIQNYAVKLWVKNDSIDILGKEMPIQIIENYEISIRPCELNNFARIFGMRTSISTKHEGYRLLMRFIFETGMSIGDLVDSSDEYYTSRKSLILKNTKSTQVFDVLDKARVIIRHNQPGCNILKYLLHRLNNKTIKNQIGDNSCFLLSNLCLEYGCIPFDKMPFCSSPRKHNPKLHDLFDCLDPTGKKHELFARLIKNNTERNSQLYTDKSDLTGFEEIDNLMKIYNDALYTGHVRRKIDEYGENLYIRSYEEDTVTIIKKLIELSANGVDGYYSSVEYWLENASHSINCSEKKAALKNMFKSSYVALIYGAAGTGKTTMIDHISNFFNDKTKIYLANTNPAVDNLKQKVHASNCSFSTIASFLVRSDYDEDFDLLIIDECSTVSNVDMRALLNKVSCKLMVLVGDVFQIESITFGNWFNIARSFVPKTSVFELKHPYRTQNENLLEFWEKVRNIGDDILEHITRNHYSERINETIFDRLTEDEIILCLNYDGLYGINNINQFLQGTNSNFFVQWGVKIYKVGDPILFNESNRFHPLIYNNSKGKINNIQIVEDVILFDIELDRPINEFQAFGYDFELINKPNCANSIIRFMVNKYKSTDDDDDGTSNAVVPFQIAYAISIHKAQGLEYSSVKIVINDEFEEMITHNIFYTAVTRAREKLKIYWTPETENKILKSFNKKTVGKDVSILSAKHDIKRVK